MGMHNSNIYWKPKTGMGITPSDEFECTEFLGEEIKSGRDSEIPIFTNGHFLDFTFIAVMIKIQRVIICVSLLWRFTALATKNVANVDMIGYAKDNPYGETTGGGDGLTTTVTSAEALQTAVSVGHSSR